ncbi:hypothetical protein [Bradyrhizobium centrosematis]|uniref:hypothetical protein n=1 Tax=Bradyrhizobium centrosematis TaxID=1300039 RepID=UPI002169216B|nr:hypothetical protein [Bradyrhizobium centrosematis]MCS3765881.1 hypothetical protein [Bradyrhizobium centrosematis]MCS3778217.1 hypothetical protein [Bradyrhizobium centrosematis]
MRIIQAIVAGERDPDVLATYCDVHCHFCFETIRAALAGNDRQKPVFGSLWNFTAATTPRCSTANAS